MSDRSLCCKIIYQKVTYFFTARVVFFKTLPPNTEDIHRSSLMPRGVSSVQDMKDPEILQSVAMISKASISPRPQPVTLLETSTVTAIFEKEFNSTALIAEYSLVMEMNSSIYDSDDHVVAQISESHRAADISNVADDRWSMDDAIATDKLRLMFGSMQVQ